MALYEINSDYFSYFKHKQWVICNNIEINLRKKKMNFKEISDKTGIAIWKFRICPLHHCFFTIDELCQIAYVLDIPLARLIEEI